MVVRIISTRGVEPGSGLKNYANTASDLRERED